MTRDQRAYCRDILDRIRRIESYTASGRDAFLESEFIQDAVIRCFEVIGEAVKRLDEDLIEQAPHIAWRDFTGFRNMLIHQYHRIKLDLVWDFAQEDLPAAESCSDGAIEELGNR